MVAVALGPPWSWAKMAEEWEAQRREREDGVPHQPAGPELMTAEMTKASSRVSKKVKKLKVGSCKVAKSEQVK